MSKKIMERGQALILVAFAIVGLVGFAALAIDGGNVFSDRRHSQNTSDTAVMAAALERVRRPTQDWKSVAVARAADNGYSAADGVTEVNVYLCSELTTPIVNDGYPMSCKALPATADPSEYVYVHIKSVVKMFFAPVIGWREVTNHTDAVARAKVPVPTNWFDGYGIATLHEGCKLPGESEAFEVAGNSNNYVIGAGVLVNANCPTDDVFVQNGNSSTLDVTTNVCVHGTADFNPGLITPVVDEGCEPVDPDRFQSPPPATCASDGYLQPLGNDKYLAIPGNYDQTGNKQFPDVNGQATVVLAKGVYCLHNGISVNAGLTITTDLNNNGNYDPASEGVFFYIPGMEGGDDIQFNGGATVNIRAISVKPNSSFDNKWLNMLIYVNEDHEADIDLSGNAGSTFTGTILAPSSHVDMGGSNTTGAGTITFDSQIIADTVRLTGGTDLVLIYNETNNATTLDNPGIEVIE